MSNGWIKTLIEPQKTADIPLRPLSEGIRRDVASTVIPAGAFFDLKNVFARTNGLQRRAGMQNYLSGASVLHPPIRTLHTIFQSTGVQYTCLLDSKGLYYTTSLMNLVKHTYTTGTVTGAVVGGVTRFTGSGTLWATAASDVKIGDVFYCSALTGTNKWGIIKAINSDTQIDLETNEGTATAGSTYEIRRAVSADAGLFPEALSLDGKLLFVDGNREVRSFDPTSSTSVFAYHSSDATFDLFPHCIAFFKDRLFFGRTVESAGTEDNRQRVRWTTTA